MNSVLKCIYWHVITALLRTPCPVRIPRSGNAGQEVNCYTVELRDGNAPFLFIEDVTNLGVRGSQWSEIDHRYNTQTDISFSEIKRYNLVICHFYGLAELKFDGIFDYIRQKLFPSAYIKLWWSDVQQIVFNSRKLFRAKRIKILELMINRHIESGGNSISSWDIMNDLHSLRWYQHPQGTVEHDRLQLFLTSLVETGDIEKDEALPFHFKVKGLALKTLSDFTAEEERHRQSLSLQQKMKFLSWILAISALLTVLATAMTVTQESLLWKEYIHFIQKDVKEP